MTEITSQMIKELRSKTGIGVAKCKVALSEAGGDIEKAIENLRKAGMASAVKKEGRATKEGCIASADSQNCVVLVEVNAETDFVVNNESFQQFASNIAEEIAQTNPTDLESFLTQKYSKDSSLTIDEYRATIIQSLGENIQIKRLQVFPRNESSSIGIYIHMGGKIVSLVEINGSSAEANLAKDIAMHVAAENPDYLNSSEIPQDVLTREKEIAKEQVKGKPENMIEKIVEGKVNAYFNQVCLIKQKYVKNPDHTVEEVVNQRGKEAGKELKIAQFQRWSVGG